MPTGMVIDVIRTLVSDADPEPDGKLVTRFAESHDPAAFAELVRRHGPAVFGVCRRVLGHAQDAEDAFQAVWLVLARRAADVRPPGAVGPWLYGVAVRTATRARALAMKRRQRQLAAAKPEAFEDAPTAADLGPVLDEELARLPERYRRAVVACDLNGRSRSQAARELGWPEGTVAARVAKGRELLAARLRRRGVTLSSEALAVVLSSAARAELPPSLASNAVAAALEFASGAASASVPPVSIVLAEGVMRAMSASRWKLPAVVLMVAGLAAGGAVLAASAGPPEKPRDPDPVQPPVVAKAAPVPAEKRPTVLRDHGDLVFSVAFAPDGKRFATGGAGGLVIAWDAAGPKKVWEARLAAPGATAVAYSPDGEFVAATHTDGVFLLNAATGQTVHKIEERGSAPHAVAFSPETAGVRGVRFRKLAFGNGRTYFVKQWTDKPGTDSGTIQFSGSPEFLACNSRLTAPLAFAPDGQRLLVTRHENVDGKYPVWMWSAGSGVPNKLLSAHTRPVSAVAWARDGARIVTASVDGDLIAWDAESAERKWREKAADQFMSAVAISPDGELVAAAGQRVDKTGRPVSEVRLFAADTGRAVGTVGGFPDGGEITAVAFSPDGTTLVVTSGGLNVPHDMTAEERKRRGEVRVWNLAEAVKSPGRRGG
jgi:RNA polymerase sigma factor (sigma-70 family)